MTITIGTNSYVDVAEADAYFASRYGYDKWEPLSNGDKEKLLTSATQELDLMCTWNNTKCDPDQYLAFPQKDSCLNVPQDIKTAQMEIAYQMLEAGSAYTGGSSSGEAPLSELKAGSVQLKFDTKKAAAKSGNPWSSGIVQSLLSSYGSCMLGSTRLVPMELQ